MAPHDAPHPLPVDPETLPEPLRGWLAAHAALRRDADAVCNAVATLDPADAIAARHLARAFSIANRMAVLHEHGEEDGIVPLLRTRVPAFGGSARVLQDDHDALDELYESVAARLTALAAAPRFASEVWSSLLVDARRLRARLYAHLEREEQTLLPVLIEAFDEGEIALLVGAQWASMESWLDEVTPWIVTATPGLSLDSLLGHLPEGVRIALPAWRHAFADRFGPVLTARRLAAA